VTDPLFPVVAWLLGFLRVFEGLAGYLTDIQMFFGQSVGKATSPTGRLGYGQNCHSELRFRDRPPGGMKSWAWTSAPRGEGTIIPLGAVTGFFGVCCTL
jgi:hypothetical protein